jgi:hypothetical protein
VPPVGFVILAIAGPVGAGGIIDEIARHLFVKGGQFGWQLRQSGGGKGKQGRAGGKRLMLKRFMVVAPLECQLPSFSPSAPSIPGSQRRLSES